MYAVIESGGQQHRVCEGEVLRLQKLDLPEGSRMEFERVLMVGEGSEVKIGAPLLAGGKVSAEVIAHGRAEKIRVFKYKRRKKYRRSQGHRQWYTEVRITGIQA